MSIKFLAINLKDYLETDVAKLLPNIIHQRSNDLFVYIHTESLSVYGMEHDQTFNTVRLSKEDFEYVVNLLLLGVPLPVEFVLANALNKPFFSSILPLNSA